MTTRPRYLGIVTLNGRRIGGATSITIAPANRAITHIPATAAPTGTMIDARRDRRNHAAPADDDDSMDGVDPGGRPIW